MSDVSIIDVDLGASVESIIGDDLTQITSGNMADIRAAISESRQIIGVKQAKQTAEKNQQNAVATALTMLIEADEHGQTVSSKDLLMAVQPHIGSMNSLVQRLKGLMRAKKMVHQLLNMKYEGDTYYYIQEPSTQENADS